MRSRVSRAATARAFTGTLLVCALSVLAAAPAAAQQREAIRIGTSSVGSTFYILAVAISEMLRKHEGIDATVEPLGGSSANMNGLATGKVEVAIANAGAAFDAYHGNKPFKAPIDVALIAQGQSSMRFILVRRDSGIKTPADLVGKTFIAKRRALPEMALIADALIDSYRLPKDAMKLVETSESNQATEALRAGSVQAAIYPGGRYMAPVQEMFRDKVVDFLYLSSDEVDRLLTRLPKYIFKTKLPAGNFPNQDRDWFAPTLNTYFVARADLPAGLVQRIARTILANAKEFSTFHPDAKEWTLANSLEEPKIPFHPGAVAFFRQAGSWQSAHERVQASLGRK